jgi:hypothetical protein
MLRQAIIMFQDYLGFLGYKAQIHFELEGCFETNSSKPLDLISINETLKHLGIDGEIVNEYWHNQWEYVSLFNGQSPLDEANNLHRAIKELPEIFSQYGVSKTLIKPVVWSGDKGKLASGCNDIFSLDTRAVHIPNAVQLNVSVLNDKGKNIVPESGFGEYLQQCFLQTSKACSLLYLPEEEAFERFKLTSYYGLADELCSPFDISGGHQGSIALYKKLGKHNQKMGEEPLLYDQFNNVLMTQDNWQKTARVEHRLGASSEVYDPYVNILFSLANVVDAIEVYRQGHCRSALLNDEDSSALPLSLFNSDNNDLLTRNSQNGSNQGNYNQGNYNEGNSNKNNSNQENSNQENVSLGAIDLFAQSDWFSNSINRVQQLVGNNSQFLSCPENIGTSIKQNILAKYQQKKIQLNSI